MRGHLRSELAYRHHPGGTRLFVIVKCFRGWLPSADYNEECLTTFTMPAEVANGMLPLRDVKTLVWRRGNHFLHFGEHPTGGQRGNQPRGTQRPIGGLRCHFAALNAYRVSSTHCSRPMALCG